MAHVFCVLILLTRVGDIVSTRLVTPTWKLETNPIARRLGWKLAIPSLALCLVPYYHNGLGFMVLVGGLFVCYSNTSRMWLARTLGEAEMEELLLRAARRSSLRRALVPLAVASASLSGIAVLFVLFSGGSRSWAFYGGFGLLSIGLGLAIYQGHFYVRLFRRARATADIR